MSCFAGAQSEFAGSRRWRRRDLSAVSGNPRRKICKILKIPASRLACPKQDVCRCRKAETGGPPGETAFPGYKLADKSCRQNYLRFHAAPLILLLYPFPMEGNRQEKK
jgi:hypothetical protein